jgi:hypothetical protein
LKDVVRVGEFFNRLLCFDKKCGFFAKPEAVIGFFRADPCFYQYFGSVTYLPAKNTPKFINVGEACLRFVEVFVGFMLGKVLDINRLNWNSNPVSEKLIT